MVHTPYKKKAKIPLLTFRLVEFRIGIRHLHYVAPTHLSVTLLNYVGLRKGIDENVQCRRRNIQLPTKMCV